VNVENIKLLRDTIAASGRLYMRGYQTVANGAVIADTVDQLHACGNEACIAGFMALLPKFRADGGRMGACGEPYMSLGRAALSEWLDIPQELALDIELGSQKMNSFVGREFCNWTSADAVRILDAVLSGELS